MHWLSHILGLDNASGAWYLFWSGFFGDVVIFAALVGFYTKHICHQDKCHRFSRHTINGSPYCGKHHEGAR